MGSIDFQGNLSLNMKSARAERGWTQADLAEAAGVSVPTIQRVESNQTWPEIENLKAIARALKRTASELFRDPSGAENLDTMKIEMFKRILKAEPVELEVLLKVIRRSSDIN